MTVTATASAISIGDKADRLRPVRIWLYVMAALVLLMVVVGGMTRLTGSGLSITSWKPISGVIPPLSDADWAAEFEAYKQIPQYQFENSWMSVEDFKSIFWWEWGHRFLGRVLGLVFAVPFAVFLLQKRLTRELAVPLGVLFVLGGFQGFLGWWMVSSGLSELTSVSQYRLAAHLTAAAILFMALIWVGRSIDPHTVSKGTSVDWWAAVVLSALLVWQIAGGAFVAGLDAGMSYNTWPLMDGALIPSGLGAKEPGWKNLFENALTVQFIHRSIAYGIVIYVALLISRQARAGGFAGVHAWLLRIGLLVVVQVCLGIATLLTAVQIDLAVAHQITGFLLLGSIVLYLADLRRSMDQARTSAISAA